MKIRYAITATLTAGLLILGVRGAVGHIGNAQLPEGCGSCHIGHGMPNQPMLPLAEEEMCYQCHGSEDDRTAMQSQGRLAAGVRLGDIEREFQKPYRHPVREGSGHSSTERLPSFKSARINHAECVDCHNPHERITAGRKQVYKVPGYSIAGQYLEVSLNEYEICLKCHSDYIGADRGTKNLRAEFAPGVRSQHPVTTNPSGIKLPSLAAATPGQSQSMRCSDCHTSDDPDAPQGPHGSSHRFLLSGNYTLDVKSNESSYAYEFCYSCHDRMSILANESFPLHREHIIGDPFSGRSGTSCYTCHASHGSRDSEHLIDFNPKAVTRDGQTGILQYQATGNKTGTCTLRCHDSDHSPAAY
jgi:predicted CXXCH cytochrome family protein